MVLVTFNFLQLLLVDLVRIVKIVKLLRRNKQISKLPYEKEVTIVDFYLFLLAKSEKKLCEGMYF